MMFRGPETPSESPEADASIDGQAEQAEADAEAEEPTDQPKKEMTPEEARMAARLKLHLAPPPIDPNRVPAKLENPEIDYPEPSSQEKRPIEPDNKDSQLMTMGPDETVE